MLGPAFGRMSKTVRVFEVLYDGPAGCSPGPNGDGTFIYRTKDRERAEAKARASTFYGRQTTYYSVDAPLALAQRWGLA